MIDQKLTRDEWRTLGITMLTAAATTLVAGLVSWGIEVAKRPKAPAPPKDPPS